MLVVLYSIYMTLQELQWLQLLYERHVLYEHEPKFQSAKSVALHCTHWAYLLYHSLSGKNKVIKYNNDHSVCVIDNIYIDMECNAFIKGFDWDSASSTKNAILAPINPLFPIKYHLLEKFYRSTALKTIKIEII